MKTKKDILDVGICIYKKSLLKKLLTSLKRQTYKKVLYIFLIDNPTESQKIKAIINKYNLNCIIYSNPKNLGEYKCYDILLKKSKSKYFLRVDDDDYFLEKTYIEMLIKKIQLGYDFVLPRVKLIDEKNNKKRILNDLFKDKKTKREFIRAFFIEKSMIFYSIFRRKKLLKLHNKYFLLNLSAYGEGILNLRVCSELNGIYCPQSTYCYVRHGNHSTNKIKNKKIYLSQLKYSFLELLNIFQIKKIYLIYKILYSLISIKNIFKSCLGYLYNLNK
jgi:hypothetical protein